MPINSSWPEWIACLAGAAGAVIAFRRGRRWIALGLAVLMAAWFCGTAKGLLLPAVFGNLALLLALNTGGRWRRAGLILALGGSVASAILCRLFPLPEVPPLSGPHAVGTLTFELAARDQAPALVVQVWYPARENKELPLARWLPDPELAPRFPFHRIGNALARSRIGLELSETSGRFPVIFYEHSWTGHRAENVAQVEELASQGFVVVAVDHPGQAGRVKYNNGAVVASRLPATLDLSTEEAVADFEKLAERCLRERAANLARVKQAFGSGIASRLTGRLVLEKAGVFGFSFGGTSALRLCALDPSFHAGANEDGLFLGDENPPGPFLFFDQEMPGWLTKEAGPGEGAAEALTRRSEKRILSALEKNDRFRVVLDGTRHESFSDRIFLCQFPRLARVGTRPAAEVHRMITSRLGDFFKRVLGERTAGRNQELDPARQ